MKKIILLLIVLFAFSIVACSSTNTADKTEIELKARVARNEVAAKNFAQKYNAITGWITGPKYSRQLTNILRNSNNRPVLFENFNINDIRENKGGECILVLTSPFYKLYLRCSPDVADRFMDYKHFKELDVVARIKNVQRVDFSINGVEGEPPTGEEEGEPPSVEIETDSRYPFIVNGEYIASIVPE